MRLSAVLLAIAVSASFVASVEAQSDESRKIKLVCAKTLRQTIDVPSAVVNIRVTDNGEDGDFLQFADGTQYFMNRKTSPYTLGMKHPDGLAEQCIFAQ